MKRRTTHFLAATVAAGCAVALLTACTGSSKKPVSSVGSVSSSSSPSPTPSVAATTKAATTPPKPVVAPLVNPLTGIGAPAKTPVIAVKIDDTAPGRPQQSIDKADIVYIEQAEGGLSRLLAVFGTNKPVVGYVRSTRPSDPELLLQYGRITLAASGGGGDALVILDRSGLTSWINDRGAGFYDRVARQSDYINLTLDLAKVATKVKTPAAKSIGFTWSNGYGRTTWQGPGQTVQTYVGSTLVTFRWDASIRKYVRYIDGVKQLAADGRPVATPNVIVQSCLIQPHYGDVDVNGNPSQFTNTIGSGGLTVFRNGHAFRGTWSRRAVTAGTALKDAKGNTIPLAPGGAWVALIGRGTAITAS